MKKLVLALILTSWAISATAADVAVNTRRVCHDLRNRSGQLVKNRDGSVQQSCRWIKIHKKYDATRVPVK